MIERIIIAGAGGQGVMLLGKILAEAAFKENKYVTWFPSYGAEVRGGTAYCMVVISKTPISSPYIKKADTLIIMNEPSFDKFKMRLAPGGLLLANRSLIQKVLRANTQSSPLCAYPFTDIAAKLGNVRVANMVALGSLITRKRIVKAETVRRVMREMAPRGATELIVINEKALQEGMKLS